MVPTKKASAKKSTTTKSKAVKVARKSKHAVPNKKKAPPPTLPKDWPVTSRPPIYPPTASALAPGSLLQHTCSGNDIHLARNAVARPNLAKERGKYLLILPGNLSLKKLANNDNKRSLSQSSIGLAEASSNIGISQTTNTGLSQSSVDATKKVPPPILGTIQDLNTDHPKFVIPFPEGKTLVFPGKKVETTSKYMILSCSTKKKGSVVCKSMFSSAIVFGQPKWHNDNNEEDEISVMEEEPAEETSFPISHYGGSQRTVDGVGKCKNAKNTSEQPLLVPIHSHQLTQPQSMSLELSDYATKPPASPPDVALSLDEESNDEYQFDGKGGGNTSTSAKRLPPKRKAAQKQKYTPSSSSSSEDDEDEDSDHESIAKPVAKPVAKRTARARGTGGKSATIHNENRHAKYSDDEDIFGEDETVSRILGKTTAAARRGKGSGGENQPIELDNDDNDDDDDSDVYSGDDIPSTTPRSTSRRQSVSKNKAKYAEADADKEDEEESDESEEENSAKRKPAPKKQATNKSNTRAASSRGSMAATKSSKRVSKANPIILDDDDDDDASIHAYSEDSGNDDEAIPERRTVSRRSSSTNRPNYAKVLESSESEEESEKEESKEEKAPKTSARNPAARKSTTLSTNASKRRKSSPSSSDASKATTKTANARTKSGNVSVLETISPSQEKPKPTARKRKLSNSEETPIDFVDDKDENNGNVDHLEEVATGSKRRRSSLLAKKPSVSRKPKVVGIVEDKQEEIQSPAAPIRSPLRSRRRKSPGGKATKSPAKKTLDLSNDDEFSFG